MIKIIQNDSAVKQWTTGNITHPGSNGSTNVQYVLNHNMGDQPDLVKLLVWGGASVGFIAMDDIWTVSSAERYSQEAQWTLETDKNSTHVRIWKVSSSNKTVRFRAFWF